MAQVGGSAPPEERHRNSGGAQDDWHKPGVAA